MIFMQQTVKMPQPRHSRAKEHDRKWRESNKLKVKVKNKDQYTKTLQKRLEDPELHVKMKADGAERTRIWRAKKKAAMLASSSPDPPPSEPSSPGTSSAPTEEPDVPAAPVPDPEMRAAAVLRITSGRRTRGTAPAQLQESDQEDELPPPPARRFVDR